MTTEEIKEKVTFNNKKIEELLDPSVFILQPEVQKYIEENEYLKSICPHNFINNTCIFCGKIKNP